MSKHGLNLLQLGKIVDKYEKLKIWQIPNGLPSVIRLQVIKSGLSRILNQKIRFILNQ